MSIWMDNFINKTDPWCYAASGNPSLFETRCCFMPPMIDLYSRDLRRQVNLNHPNTSTKRLLLLWICVGICTISPFDSQINYYNKWTFVAESDMYRILEQIYLSCPNDDWSCLKNMLEPTFLEWCMIPLFRGIVVRRIQFWCLFF